MKKIFFLFFISLALVSFSYSKNLEPDVYQGTAKIEAIHAHLFYDHKGTFSEDFLPKNDIALWNTIIGEGFAAGNPSSSTYIVVEISGKDISSRRHAKINIIVSDFKKAQIVNVTRKFSMYDNYRKTFVPLIVPDTGCGHITVTAKLIGRGLEPSSITQTIPYKCGE